MSKREHKTGDGFTWIETWIEGEPDAGVVATDDAQEAVPEPQPDPEWLAGLPPDVRSAHDRWQQERAKLQRAHERKYAMIGQARKAQEAETGVAKEMRDKATEAVEEEYRAALSRTDAQYRQSKQAASEQYDQAQLQYDQALRRWHDAQNAYLAGVVKEA